MDKKFQRYIIYVIIVIISCTLLDYSLFHVTGKVIL